MCDGLDLDRQRCVSPSLTRPTIDKGRRATVLTEAGPKRSSGHRTQHPLIVATSAFGLSEAYCNITARAAVKRSIVCPLKMSAA